MSSEFTIAVHAMIWLNRQGGTLDSETLAEKVGTNPVRIRKVMAKMRKKRAGGHQGGNQRRILYDLESGRNQSETDLRSPRR